MTSANRKRIAYEQHRRFLFNVTGLTFDHPFVSLSGLVFKGVEIVSPDEKVENLTIYSVIREREDLFR